MPSNYRVPPQINASLMREMRMIFKTFMAHRTTDLRSHSPCRSPLPLSPPPLHSRN
jgi:hypothetical protein